MWELRRGNIGKRWVLYKKNDLMRIFIGRKDIALFFWSRKRPFDLLSWLLPSFLGTPSSKKTLFSLVLFPLKFSFCLVSTLLLAFVWENNGNGEVSQEASEPLLFPWLWRPCPERCSSITPHRSPEHQMEVSLSFSLSLLIITLLCWIQWLVLWCCVFNLFFCFLVSLCNLRLCYVLFLHVVQR